MDTVKARTKIYDSDTGVYFVYHGETDIDMVVGLVGTIDASISNATIPAGHVSGLAESISAAVADSTIILGTTASTVKGAIWLVDD